MDPLLERSEIQTLFPHHYELAIQDELAGAECPKRGQHLRKVARHRTRPSADQGDLLAVSEHQRPEAVPFGLVLPPVTLWNPVGGAESIGSMSIGIGVFNGFVP